MLGTTRSGVLGALACGLIGAAGCGGDDVARVEPGPAIAPASEHTRRSRAPAPPMPHRRSAPCASIPPSPAPASPCARVVEVADPDGDGVRLGYVWSIDGENVAAHGAMLEIPAKTRRGAPVELRVTASDGHARERGLRRLDGRGQPRAAHLGPRDPAGRSHHGVGSDHGGGDGSDPDGDALSFTYTWSVNDETTDERGPVFPGERLKRGDVLQVSVVASDEQSESEPLVSPPIEVTNAAPVIRSQPVFTNPNAAFTYHVDATDRRWRPPALRPGERSRGHDGARDERRRRLEAAPGPGGHAPGRDLGRGRAGRARHAALRADDRRDARRPIPRPRRPPRRRRPAPRPRRPPRSSLSPGSRAP